jgi:hypothetical protein
VEVRDAGWIARLERLVLAWSILVLAVTGVVLFAQDRSLRVMPTGSLPLAQVTHGWAAMLAVVFAVAGPVYRRISRPGFASWRAPVRPNPPDGPSGAGGPPP